MAKRKGYVCPGCGVRHMGREPYCETCIPPRSSEAERKLLMTMWRHSRKHKRDRKRSEEIVTLWRKGYSKETALAMAAKKGIPRAAIEGMIYDAAMELAHGQNVGS